jgi:hypothetical protein
MVSDPISMRFVLINGGRVPNAAPKENYEAIRPFKPR